MKKQYFLFIIGLFFIVTALAYNFISFNNPFGVIFNHALYHISALLAIIYGFSAAKKYSLKSERGRSITYLTSAITFWFVGDLIGNIMQYGFGQEIFPSFIDIIYIFGYPSLFVALFIEIRITKVNWNFQKILLAFILSILLTAASAYATIYLAYDPANDYWANVFSLFYGLEDILLANMAILLLIFAQEYREGKFFSIYMGLFLAMLLTLIADISYGAFFQQYDSGIVLYKSIDLFFIASYLAFAYSFFSLNYLLAEVQDKIKETIK
jgi:hypothetical protein